MKTYPLPIYVQRFFTERLESQLRASPNTVASPSSTIRAHFSRNPLFGFYRRGKGRHYKRLVYEGLERGGDPRRRLRGQL